MKRIAVILAGGYGTRLYPFSTRERPKQFLDLITKRPMIDETYDRISQVYDDVYINTLERYKQYVYKYDKTIIEPFKKGTALSVFVSVVHLYKKYGDCIISIVPSDHWVSDEFLYRFALEDAMKKAEINDVISLIGILPTQPETDFGYINRYGDRVISFTEKPNKTYAKGLIKRGSLWNSGIFTFKASYMIDLYREVQPFDIDKAIAILKDKDINYLYKNINIDMDFERAIVEKCDSLEVVLGLFKWNDLGTLNRLSDVIAHLTEG